MRTNTQEAVLSAYIVSIGKRTPRDAAQDAAELCRLATSLNRLNEIACNSGLTERQERRKQNLQTQIKAVLERAGLVLNHFNSDPRGYAVYLDLPDGSYNSFGGRECGYGTNHGTNHPPNGHPDPQSPGQPLPKLSSRPPDCAPAQSAAEGSAFLFGFSS
jgi:hypothetical protein